MEMRERGSQFARTLPLPLPQAGGLGPAARMSGRAESHQGRILGPEPTAEKAIFLI